MANVKEAVEFVLRQEDAMLSGIATKAPGDRGGLTRFGLTAKWHPELVANGFFQMNREDALAIAQDTYAREYIPHLDLGKINRTAVAVAILSFAVVEGAGAAVVLIQNTLSELGFPLIADGSAGPKTIAALNAADPFMFVAAYVNRQRNHFASIVGNDLSQQKWLNGWNNRATAVLQYAQRTLVQ